MIDETDRRRTLAVRTCLAVTIFGTVHAIAGDHWPALVLAGIALGAPPWVPNPLA